MTRFAPLPPRPPPPLDGMRVRSVFDYPNLGPGISVELDGPVPAFGSRLRRRSDGAIWKVRGVERHCIAPPPDVGEFVGLLLDLDARPREDDWVDRCDWVEGWPSI